MQIDKRMIYFMIMYNYAGKVDDKYAFAKAESKTTS